LLCVHVLSDFNVALSTARLSDSLSNHVLCATTLHSSWPRQFRRALQVMTRLEHTTMDVNRPGAGQSSPPTATQPASLGPVDPSWLAKLSGTLGIHPARTVAPLLMSIWPGVHSAAICCREACAYLMQVCSILSPAFHTLTNVRIVSCTHAFAVAIQCQRI
jgi:hypothetical protein